MSFDQRRWTLTLLTYACSITVATQTAAPQAVSQAEHEQPAQHDPLKEKVPPHRRGGEATVACGELAAADFSQVSDAPTQIMTAKLMKAVGDVPSYCHVQGYVAPSIGIAIGLPAQWNGKFIEMGCGGHCGMLDSVFAASCLGALRRGYACIISDMGHMGTGVDGLWAYQNLQAKIDWGYRATHVTALAGKAITEYFYNRAPAKSYFMGCSTGGRQGLQEAQRFPWDFDGIIAGAPPVDLATLYMTYVWGIRAAHDENGNPLLGDRELQLLTDAAVAKCEEDDGVKDGIIGDPLHCSSDPGELVCSENLHSECLTPLQVTAVRRLYEGPSTSTGRKLSPGGPLLGSEYGTWRMTYVGENGQPPSVAPIITNGFKYFFFWPEAGPTWELKDFNFDSDYSRMGVMAALVDASNPDLRKFKSAGGKLLMYVGANDWSALVRSTIEYYETVERTMGGRAATQDFMRLFLLPGVEHCSGGSGADTVDYLSYLEAWVEKGQAPDRLIAAHLNESNTNPGPTTSFPLDPKTIAFTRPIYSYPIRAKYKGSGDPDDAANFSEHGR